MFCGRCGAEIDDSGARYCPACGEPRSASRELAVDAGARLETKAESVAGKSDGPLPEGVPNPGGDAGDSEPEESVVGDGTDDSGSDSLEKDDTGKRPSVWKNPLLRIPCAFAVAAACLLVVCLLSDGFYYDAFLTMQMASSQQAAERNAGRIAVTESGAASLWGDTSPVEGCKRNVDDKLQDIKFVHLDDGKVAWSYFDGDGDSKIVDVHEELGFSKFHFASAFANSNAAGGLRENGEFVYAYSDNGGVRLDDGPYRSISSNSKSAFLVAMKDGSVTVLNPDGFDRNFLGLRHVRQFEISSSYAVAVSEDGFATAYDAGDFERLDMLDSWNRIAYASASGKHVVGLKDDGTVVAAGDNSCGQCDVGDWTDIVMVAASNTYTLGLKSDGSLVAAGKTDNLSDWFASKNLGKAL